jgi:hypothetical protein
MSMLKRVGRLFVIKTRFEAYAITYAIAVGAVERGRHYIDIFPGIFGWIMAAACTGVVFLAGAKLLDAVRPEPAPVRKPAPLPARRRERPGVSRNRPRRSFPSGAASAALRRTD